MQLSPTLAILGAALAVLVSPARGNAIEIGGYAGATATNIRTTYECPDDLPANEDCITMSSPHYGGQGPSLGLYARYAATRHIRLEADVAYTMRGYDVGSVVRFHYFEVPLLVRADSADDQSRLRAFALAGLAPAVLAWCHESGVAFDNYLHESFSYSSACRDAPVVDRSPSRFDLGAVIGAGVGWKLDVGVVELQWRYTQSLIDIEPDEGGKTVNHGFTILASFGRSIGGQ